MVGAWGHRKETHKQCIFARNKLVTIPQCFIFHHIQACFPHILTLMYPYTVLFQSQCALSIATFIITPHTNKWKCQTLVPSIISNLWGRSFSTSNSIKYIPFYFDWYEIYPKLLYWISNGVQNIWMWTLVCTTHD